MKKTGIVLGATVLALSLGGCLYSLYQAREIEHGWVTHALQLHAEKINQFSTAYTRLAEPNTMDDLALLTQKVTTLGWGVQLRYYSPYALDWRNQFETPFNTRAWQEIQIEPKRLVKEMNAQGQNGAEYRLAQGIFLSSGCQDCSFLNNKGERVSLEPGQLIGIMEWAWPLSIANMAYEKELTAWHHHQWQQAGVLLALGLLSLAGIFCSIRTIRTEYEKKYADLSKEVSQYQRILRQERSQYEENSQFTRIVSREIRTPVNSLLGLSELLLSEDLSDSQNEKLKLLEESIQEIVAILDNIAELKKIELDDSPLYPAKISLRQLVHTSLAQFGSKAAQRNLTLLCHVDKKVPESVLLDGQRVQQVLNNLLNNAMHHTRRGGIAVEITAIDPAPNFLEILFKVIDTGVGIPESKLPYVFHHKQAEGIFVISDDAQLSSRLIVCEKLIAKMAGNIGVNSELDKGSTFWFSLQIPTTRHTQSQSDPANQLDYSPYACIFDLPMDSARLMDFIAKQDTHAQKARLSKKQGTLKTVAAEGSLHILLAEDDPVNCMVATNILRKMGHRVQVAGNGLEALQKVLEHDFDVVLMDIQMPEMNGVSATQEIRKLPDIKKSRIPIIALTADAMAGDKEKYLRSGLDGYISKPFRIEQLRQMIESIVTLRT
jgi:signal transduction histidine kinase/CheY-like chemotaxis protein